MYWSIVMQRLYIEGGHKLYGELQVPTAKNAMLPLIAASIMNTDETFIHSIVPLVDVKHMIDILESLGCKCNIDNGTLVVHSTDIHSYSIREDYTKKIRSSIFMLGPLLSVFRKAKVAYPGGCNIGARPIDLHLKGLRELGVIIEEKHGYIYCDGSHMNANEIHLDFPSVGATENLMMACVKLQGITTIHNVAREPEISDLANFLNSMGARVYGAGTSTIVVHGVDKLHGTEYTPIRDRIICGTYLIACGITGGSIRLIGSPKEHNMALISSLKSAGAKITCDSDAISIECNKKLKALDSIETQVFPGFPTDLQSQMLALECTSIGASVITENLFETRFKMCTELIKMGADITLKDRLAFVKGVPTLYGADVEAFDLRGGAGLVLAGLGAEGYTTVQNVEHIDRGYYQIEQDLAKLGASVNRI